MVRIGLLSWWHVHAKDYAGDADAHPGVQLVATWDENAERGQAEARKRGLRWYSSYKELLDAPDIDAVIVTTPTNMHREVMLAASAAGKHIFTEKVVAATLKDTDDIIEATAQHNIKLMVSLPRLYTPYTQAIQKLIADGTLGKLTSVRVRHTHGGALRTPERPDGWLPQHFYDPVTAQGGGLIDLVHPVYLLHTFLGEPISVNAALGYVNERAVDDNAAVLLSYNGGAIGIGEIALTNVNMFAIEVHGTQGSVRYFEPEKQIWVKTFANNEWVAHALPGENPPSAFEQWITHITQGTTATDNIASARALTKVIEAAYQAAGAGRNVTWGS
jgi:predicted dehydrogenase